MSSFSRTFGLAVTVTFGLTGPALAQTELKSATRLERHRNDIAVRAGVSAAAGRS
jgi:hypothetical protein